MIAASGYLPDEAFGYLPDEASGFILDYSIPASGVTPAYPSLLKSWSKSP